ncbi:MULTISPECIES: hypothetical protein [unclassified Pseudoalteromonas]|uniref:hypothetical protein n=1 Tax=unclassified Pseudoalteromonas TaxID=194690 RepID=UPI002097F69E|nr:hypothetical protein [Pseudoalteromonas sp. XMcav2-N]MCO7191370.1 hypothetical protein [Pseudoalteromonas sp. XMcav2-N]
MHPFSLDKSHKQRVAGGHTPISDLLEEDGGPIDITQAIPEDGLDPAPIFL